VPAVFFEESGFSINPSISSNSLLWKRTIGHRHAQKQLETGASDIVKAERSGEDPRATGGLVSGARAEGP